MDLGLFAMAALAVASNSAFAGHTAAEVLAFLGDGVLNPVGGEVASFTGGATPSVDALPGDTVGFPVYVQNLTGDYAHTLLGFSYDSWTSTASAPLISGGSSPVSGVPAWTGATANGLYDGLTTDAVLLMTRLTRRAYDSVASPGEGLATGDAVHVGWIVLDVSALAMDGDSIPLRLGIGEGAAAGASGWATNPGAPIGALITTGLGWDTTGVDGLGGYNTFRQQNPLTDVSATALNHRSTLDDGVINIIPEPATFGLLGLGLLAIRRRRA
jgi:hypothetical protein